MTEKAAIPEGLQALDHALDDFCDDMNSSAYSAISDARDAIEAQLHALQADAGRLDWLADAMRGADLAFILNGAMPNSPVELRAAIDAARGGLNGG